MAEEEKRKLPLPPHPADWDRPEPVIEVVPAGEILTRLVYTGGEHPGAWDLFRHFGPTSSRFDHHQLDDEFHSYTQDRGIMYLARGPRAFVTCIAECFQEQRKIKRFVDAPAVATFETARALELLDLRGVFSTRMGASMAIHTGSRSIAREWSQLLYDCYPEVDGLLYGSSMHGGEDAIALYERAHAAFPRHALNQKLLSDPLLKPALADAARELGYKIADDA